LVDIYHDVLDDSLDSDDQEENAGDLLSDEELMCKFLIVLLCKY